MGNGALILLKKSKCSIFHNITYFKAITMEQWVKLIFCVYHDSYNLYCVHFNINTFSKQAFNESLDFCNSS